MLKDFCNTFTAGIVDSLSQKRLTEGAVEQSKIIIIKINPYF